MKRSMLNRLALANMMVLAGMGQARLRELERDYPRRCALPDCQRTTTHNGGYCSAEHCRLHRQKLKAKGL